MGSWRLRLAQATVLFVVEFRAMEKQTAVLVVVELTVVVVVTVVVIVLGTTRNLFSMFDSAASAAPKTIRTSRIVFISLVRQTSNSS